MTAIRELSYREEILHSGHSQLLKTAAMRRRESAQTETSQALYKRLLLLKHRTSESMFSACSKFGRKLVFLAHNDLYKFSKKPFVSRVLRGLFCCKTNA